VFSVLSQFWGRLWPGASSRRAWGGLRRRAFDVGIAGRLGVAFAAVAVLATAANIIAEHGTEIIQTTSFATPIGRAPLPRRLRVAAEASPALSVARAEIHDSAILEALDRYERAVEHRAKSDTTESRELLKTAGARLKSQADVFVGEAGKAAVDARSVSGRVGSLLRSGDEIVRVSDARRMVLAAYWSHFESVDGQVKKTLDRNNWRIFGRVISRQSLLSLSRGLDDIRRESATLNGSEENPSLLDALTQSQALFTSALEANATGLGRSQGAEWVSDLRREFGAVIASRTRLSELNAQNPQGLGALEGRAQGLRGAVREVADGVARRTAAARAQIDSARVEENAPAPTFVPAPEATPAPARGASTEMARGDTGEGRVVSESARANSDGVTIAAISGLVLLILFVISVATVRSIVVPIRQFIRTTGQLAAGDEEARFVRGGIKELDALAVSLNRMARSLADARAATREYQGALESRVDQRTRQLQHLAEHDPLTGLPNRRQLVAHLNTALERAERERLRVAVFFLDLDNFKNVNDSMGHAFGDLVLKGVAQRLRDAAGPSGFAARLGGDEFTVVYTNMGGRDEVAEIGTALVHAFQRPLSIDGRELVISVSGGASIYPDHERGSDALLQAADAALFRAKNSGRARVSLFSPELLEAASMRFSLEQGLRRALEHGELELWFQPEVSFATLNTKLVEALLRWRLPDGRYLTPGDFLSVAEDSGLMSNINDWVLQTAIRHAAEWHHGAWPDARVAINVSARQLLDTTFTARMQELLQGYRLPARCLEIELTETVLQTEVATVEVLQELRGLGISIALDDFGTGYSSLASLERLPLTRVKLDRSLIDTIDTSPRSLAIARALIGLCENLGLEVTAEGVEREEQLALLVGSPGTMLQGYLLARPMKPGDMPEALGTVRATMESLLIAGAPGLPTAAQA
jgi:diguanylate cyclase (GGDEF)-like protein